MAPAVDRLARSTPQEVRLLKSLILRTPFGAIAFDPHDRHGKAQLTGREDFQTRLFLDHRDPHGHLIEHRDLGSGLVTNVGVQAMANDFAWSAQLNLATLALSNFHAWGTGVTAATVFDIACQTLAAPTTTTAVTGTQTLASTANTAIYQTVGLITAGGSLAITEWGLHTLATLTASTGTPFTATTASTWQDTGSAQTASSATVRGDQQTIVVPGTTAVYGLNLSNTTHIGTIPAWWKQSDGTVGSTPGATEAFTIKPVLWDHRVFSAINVVNLDSIQFTYQLTVQSGG